MNTQERNYYLIVLSIIVIAIILASCGIKNAENYITPISIRQSAFTPTPPKKTTPDPSSTETMEPTLAYWATAQEERFAEMYTQIAGTKSAINEIATQFPQLCGFDFESVFTSSDGEWIANDCRYFTDEFRVFQKNSSILWIIPLSELFEDDPNDIGSVDALHWSSDGKYLYFTNRHCCPDNDTLSTGDTLFILDLKSGTWKPKIMGYFNYYSFSPIEERLAYIVNSQANANSKIDLRILDLATGKEDLINIGNFEQAGYAVWKQDGQQLILNAQTGNRYDENQKYSLALIDLQKKTSKILILNSDNPSYVTNWSNKDILTIRTNKIAEYGEYYIGYHESFYYDLLTDKITPISNSP